MADERRQQYEQHKANGGKGSYQDWKSRQRKKKLKGERLAREWEERIAAAQTDPLYAKVHNLISGSEDFESAKPLLNKARRTNQITGDEYNAMSKFLQENQDTFFSENGRIPFFPQQTVKDATTPISETTTATETSSSVNTGESNSSKKRKQRQAEQQTIKDAAEEVAEETIKEEIEGLGESNLKKIFNKRNLNIGLNAFFAVSDYKSAREEGKGVIGSAAKAGGLFVAGEVLGGGLTLPALSLAKAAPKMAISGLESAQKMTRQMNSIQRVQTFGEAYFQDTQQLGTMRQAGMELAKMSQYNLQQSMMGTEAQYMHRI